MAEAITTIQTRKNSIIHRVLYSLLIVTVELESQVYRSCMTQNIERRCACFQEKCITRAAVNEVAPCQLWLHSKTSGGGCRNWQLFRSCSFHVDYYCVHQKLSADFVPTELAYIIIVLSHKTPLQQQFYSEYLSVLHHSVGIYEVLSLHANPHKTHMLCTWVL